MKKNFATLGLLSLSILFCLPGCDKEDAPGPNFQCATPAPAPPLRISDTSAVHTQTNEVYTLPLAVHIVRDSSGNGLDNSISASILNLLNHRYKNTSIQFLLTGSDYIDDSYYYDRMDETKAAQLMDENISSHALHLYILGTHTDWYNGKQSQSLPRRALVIHGKHTHTDIILQEIGNCLGLYSTPDKVVKES